MKAFAAKWGGLIIAIFIVVVLAVFGGIYLYASTRVDATLNWVTQDYRILNFQWVGMSMEQPLDAVYHLTISVNNNTDTPADIQITGAMLNLDELQFAITGSAGWNGIVPANGFIVFEGDITLKPADSQELEGRNVTLEISGTLMAHARYSFIEKQKSRPLLISTVGIIRPTVVSTAAAG
jgi:hypothetical protein